MGVACRRGCDNRRRDEGRHLLLFPTHDFVTISSLSVVIHFTCQTSWPLRYEKPEAAAENSRMQDNRGLTLALEGINP